MKDIIQDFFFRAMQEGYAAGADKEIIPGLPGWKTISFEDGNFRLVDAYHVTKGSSASSGFIMIWESDNPIWVMHFGGWYSEFGADEVLKPALYTAYSNFSFVGGRGPVHFENNKGTYSNFVDKSDFSEFSGQEMVTSKDGVRMGWHWYRGMEL